MTTIKSYTDISQSKKLAEFLPLESADACWTNHLFDNLLSSWRVESTPPQEYKHLLDRFIVKGYLIEPAWGLAALISVLPRSIEFKGDKYYLRFMKEYVEYANDEISITGRCLHTTGNNNLIDACYEMILKLHEQKLL